MLAAARHSAIIAEVQRERIVPAADLPQMLGVSLMTVRRDIEALDAGGAADVFHQSASPATVTCPAASAPPWMHPWGRGQVPAAGQLGLARGAG